MHPAARPCRCGQVRGNSALLARRPGQHHRVCALLTAGAGQSRGAASRWRGGPGLHRPVRPATRHGRRGQVRHDRVPLARRPGTAPAGARSATRHGQVRGDYVPLARRPGTAPPGAGKSGATPSCWRGGPGLHHRACAVRPGTASAGKSGATASRWHGNRGCTTRCAQQPGRASTGKSGATTSRWRAGPGLDRPVHASKPTRPVRASPGRNGCADRVHRRAVSRSRSVTPSPVPPVPSGGSLRPCPRPRSGRGACGPSRR